MTTIALRRVLAKSANEGKSNEREKKCKFTFRFEPLRAWKAMAAEARSLAATLPTEILQFIYNSRLERLLRTTPGSLALGQARFAGVCSSWRAAAFAVGITCRIESLSRLCALLGVISDKHAGALARSLRQLEITQDHPRARPASAFVPLTRILALAPQLRSLNFIFKPSPHDQLHSKLSAENDRSDWKDVFAKLVTLSKLSKLHIRSAVFEADDILGYASHSA